MKNELPEFKKNIVFIIKFSHHHIRSADNSTAFKLLNDDRHFSSAIICFWSAPSIINKDYNFDFAHICEKIIC